MSRNSESPPAAVSTRRFVEVPDDVAGSIDGLSVMDVTSRIAMAGDVETVWSLGVAALRRYGFEYIHYGFTRFHHHDALGDPADALFLTNQSPEFVKLYFESGFFARTPMFRWVRNHVGASSWKWAWDEREAGRLSDGEIKAMDDNLAAGVKAGWSISFPPTSSRSKGAMSLAARPEITQAELDATWAAHEDELMVLCNIMHLKLTQLPYPVERRPLTERQREALEWVADGKTTQDIALLMNISTAMVEKHLRLARDALSVETTAQAVAKASFLNQIFTVDPSRAWAER